MSQALNLTDEAILKLTKDKTLVKDIPLFHNYSAKLNKKDCGCAKDGGLAKAKREIFNTIKVSLVALPPDKVTLLKSKLNTDKLIVYYKSNNSTTRIEL